MKMSVLILSTTSVRNISHSKKTERDIIINVEYTGLSCQDSSVGIATRYGLDGLGIESRGGRDFPHPSRPAIGPNQLPMKWVPGLSRG
jgi:hypothetical protein